MPLVHQRRRQPQLPMQEDQNQGRAATLFCPSFNIYSSNRHLANIASRIAQEERGNGLQQRETRNDSDEEFEFVSARGNPDDASFPVFPVFNRDLLLGYQEERRGNRDFAEAVGIPPRKLFVADDEDRNSPSSSSLSEADDLERVPPGMYCFWTPRQSPLPSPGRCKKSNSTGYSKHDDRRRNRWRLRDLLLRRSSSDGKESYAFFMNGGQNGINRGPGEGNLGKKKDGKGRKKPVDTKVEKEKLSVKAGEAMYAKKRSKKAVQGGDYYYNCNYKKRKSYLPYRQGLAHGFFFAKMNSLIKTFHHF